MRQVDFLQVPLDPVSYNCGDGTVIVDNEQRIQKIKFKVYKFNSRVKPKNKNIVIFPHFAEFGSEIVGVLYCLPKLIREKYAGKYIIVAGWHGREYLYRHLVDEYWEIGEEFQHLREYCRAFHHASRNLKILEHKMKAFGTVHNIDVFGSLVVKQIYPNAKKSKESAIWLPMPAKEKIDYFKNILKPNSVGITARNRKCYGRNLPKEFYVKLIEVLKTNGYNPVWIGEKATSLPCPDNSIYDFSSSEQADDLEHTLALVSCLDFTVQFWTASSRLAGLVNTPFIIFESPEQIYGKRGQEGVRLELCTKENKSKIVISQYVNTLNDHDGTLDLVMKAANEIKDENYGVMIGLADEEMVKKMMAGKL